MVNWMIILVSIQLSVSEFYQEPSKLGQIVADHDCRATLCGKNMIFIPFKRINAPFLHNNCIRRCSCISEEYEELDGKCIKRNIPTEETTILFSKVTNHTEICQKYKCSLGQRIHDAKCHLNGLKCGTNMVFELVEVINGSCIQKCTCQEEFFPFKKKCHKKNPKIFADSKINKRNEKTNQREYSIMNCMRGKCFFNAVILDIGCMLDGRSCGPNMIFSAIQKGKYRISFIEYSKCIVQCLCMAGYVEEDGQCIKSVDNENSVENPCKKTKCALGMAVIDVGCYLTGRKCGKNMVFVPLTKNLRNEGQAKICMQRCSCENDDFIEGVFKCKKTEKSTISNNFMNEVMADEQTKPPDGKYDSFSNIFYSI